MLSMLIQGAEKEERRLTRRFLPHDRDVIDLGAGQLLTGREAIAQLLPGTRYLGLEMQEALIKPAQQLARTLKPPGVDVRIVHGAISTTQDRVGVWGEASYAATQRGATVPAYSLSHLITMFSIKEGFSLLMDIEGGECDLLVNDARALSKAGTVVAELHDFGGSDVNPHPMSALEARLRFLSLGFKQLAHGSGDSTVYCFAKAT